MTNYSFEISTICRTVEEYFSLPEDSVHLKTRKRGIVTARQIAMYFSKEATKLSLEQVGMLIGNKDHCTVLHSIRTVRNLYEVDSVFKKDFDEIEKTLRFIIVTKEEIYEAINQALIKHFAKVIHWKNIYKSML